MLYRILTERKNEPEATAIVARYFEAFFVLTGPGFYRRTPETALAVEVQTDAEEKLTSAAAEIKRLNGQEAP